MRPARKKNKSDQGVKCPRPKTLQLSVLLDEL